MNSGEIMDPPQLCLPVVKKTKKIDITVKLLHDPVFLYVFVKKISVLVMKFQL